MGPPRALALARAAVRTSLRPVAEESAGALVLVACSGGADSLALAVATAYAAPRLGLRAGAVVVDHGLQEGSAAVAAQAAHACREVGLDPVVVHGADVARGPGSGGPEGAARAARYTVLDDVAHALGARAVLLGHTADDQAETVLLGLARGSGARSLAGMRAHVGLLRRPFLGLRREQTEQVCTAAGLAWWTDPTNDGTLAGAPRRSQVRDRVLPVLDDVLGPGVVDALVRTAAQLDEDDAALADLAVVLLAECTVPATARAVGAPGGGPAGTGRTVLRTETLVTSPAAVRRRALRLAALAAGCPAGALTRAHVVEVDRLLTDWHGQGPLPLPGGVVARRTSAAVAGELGAGQAGDCGRLVLEHLP